MTHPPGRQLIGFGTRTEELAAYSRAVVDGDWVYVSGTIGLDPDTGALPESAEAQAQNAFRTIIAALARAGATLQDVVRTRVYLTRKADVGAVAAVLRAHLNDIRPANTTIICELPVDGAWVEIEVTARRSSP
jgi:enamine deaminase RidA (YjgF/YER057c/UK114 family)